MAVNGEHFDRFLAALNADRAAAGERYELLRRRLLLFFAARRVEPAEDCTDETLDRAARRIAEGVAAVPSMEGYLLGIARNVIREQWKKPRAAEVDWTRLRLVEQPKDPRADHLEACLEELAPQSRAWVERFYEDGGAARIRNRERLARELGIDANALRVRMHRIRARLEDCLRRCLGNESDQGDI